MRSSELPLVFSIWIVDFEGRELRLRNVLAFALRSSFRRRSGIFRRWRRVQSRGVRMAEFQARKWWIWGFADWAAAAFSAKSGYILKDQNTFSGSARLRSLHQEGRTEMP
mmetsp:Transcript_26069/g.40791  ORF Transcript_26069/g.40791 Transcript_26069/m.40791 type:complete len:110 (+) Transcript_26069:571-900(+)